METHALIINQKKMKTTNKSTVEYIDHMGSDLTVVNAARVSFNKESIWNKEYDQLGRKLFDERDQKLIGKRS